MNRQQIIQDGALYLGLYILMMFMTLWIPAVGFITLFLLPVPFVFFTYKYGLTPGILFGLVSFFFLFLITGPLALPLFLFFAVSGVVMGELYRRKKEAFAVLLGGALSFIGAIVIIFIGSIIILDVNPVEEIQSVMTESAEMTEDMLFLTGEDETVMIEGVEDVIDGLTVTIPSVMVIAGAGMALVVQHVSAALLRIRGNDAVRFPPFREWTFPKSFIWYYLITYLFILTGVDEGTALYTAVANLTPVLELVMIIQGFALVFFLSHFKRITPVIPVIFMIMAFLFPILLHIVRISGIIDLGFDLRKRMNAKK